MVHVVFWTRMEHFLIYFLTGLVLLAILELRGIFFRSCRDKVLYTTYCHHDHDNDIIVGVIKVVNGTLY